MCHAPEHRVLMDFERENGQYKLLADFANSIPETTTLERENRPPQNPESGCAVFRDKPFQRLVGRLPAAA